eukprot:jgi/Tetstr1/458959/TSEL_004430.t1
MSAIACATRMMPRRPLLRPLLPGGRALSSAGECPTGMVDGMLEHVRNQCRGEPDRALDVLRMGAALELPPRDKARVLMAMAEVEADRAHWADASDHAAQALADSAGGLKQADRAWLARWHAGALLAQAGKERDAQAAATLEALDATLLSEESPQACMPVMLAAAGRAALATVCAEGDGAELRALLGRTPPPSSLFTPELRAAWPGLADLALVHLACGRAEEATELLEAAGGSAAEAGGHEALCPLLSPAHFQENAADVALLRAQVALRARDWEAAEPLLSEALKAAEAVGSESHPRVGLVLTLLGQCYAHSARPTLAEGLYRSAAQMLHLGDRSRTKPVHASAAALVSWRYAQMLTAMPKRGHEADEWAERARAAWGAAAAAAVEEALGSLDVLKGTGTHGSGALVHLQTRRLVLCSAASA